jgi:enoyl-CoA hydratase/carnithine racemase
MNSAPVNSLSLELMIDLRKALEAATSDTECAGIILASSCRTFSAGLNMKELYGATPEHLATFWTELQGE